MADERLRVLELAARAGDPAARVRLLAERARIGQVDPSALRLAAYCGDVASRALLGAEAPERPTRSKEWFLGLATFDKAVSVRAAIIVGRIVLPAWNRLGLGVAVAALDSAEDWLRCPCLKHRLRAAEVAQLAAQPSRATTRAGVNIALAASRRDWTKTERSSANRLAARDCAAAAWNIREAFKDRLSNEREAALELCGFRDPPSLGDVRAHIETRLAVTPQ